MNDLSPEARRTLAHAKSGQSRAAHALRTRVKENVLRAVAADLPLEAAPSSGATDAKKLSAWTFPTLGAIAVVGGIATFALQHAPVEPPRPVRLQVEAPLAEQREVALIDAEEPAAVEQNVAVAGQGEQGGELPEAQPVRRTKARSHERANASARARDTGLRAEMQLLARAEAALRASEPLSALSILETHALQFSSGQLQGERDGLRLIAQCALGRDPQSALARYLREHRDGVLQGRIRASCGRFLP